MTPLTPTTKRRRRIRRSHWRPSAAQASVVAQAGIALGLTADEVRAKGKFETQVRARFAAAWALKRRWPQMSAPMIARTIGRNDHSTVLHALKRAEDMRARDDAFRLLTEQLAAGASVERGDRVSLPPAAVEGVALVADQPREPAPPVDYDDLANDLHFGGIALGSRRLIKAIRREHPERVVA